MAIIDTLFMTKTAENHTLWGRTYLYSPYKGVPPPPRGNTTLARLGFMRGSSRVSILLFLFGTATSDTAFETSKSRNLIILGLPHKRYGV